MIKLGLIGYPLAHSLSPVMQKAALVKLGIEGDYILLETAPEEIASRVEYLKNNDFRGFNVTIPHKVAIIDFLDEIDDFAQKVGAVNTVVISEDKKLSGYNTDVYGFVQAIPEDVRKNLNTKNAAILGSGGAARALGSGIAEMGITELKIFTLKAELEKADEIKQILNKNYPQLDVSCCVLDEKVDLAEFSLVVNATPVGMEGKFEGISPLSQYSLDSLAKDAFIYDIVYKPRETELIKLANQRGLQTLSGLDMLVLQGARGFELWTGVEPPVEVMKQALLSRF